MLRGGMPGRKPTMPLAGISTGFLFKSAPSSTGSPALKFQNAATGGEATMVCAFQFADHLAELPVTPSFSSKMAFLNSAAGRRSNKAARR